MGLGLNWFHGVNMGPEHNIFRDQVKISWSQHGSRTQHFLRPGHGLKIYGSGGQSLYINCHVLRTIYVRLDPSLVLSCLNALRDGAP